MDDDDAFGSHEHSDSTAADQTALEMPAHGDDADPTSIGYVDESDFGASPSFGSGFGEKTETWATPREEPASPLLRSSGADDMDDGGFGGKTDNWSALPTESDDGEDGNDRTMQGVTLEPLPRSSSSGFAVASSLFPEQPKPLVRDPRRASADRPSLGEGPTSKPGVPDRIDDANHTTGRALRIPSKPAVDRVRKVAPPVAVAPPEASLPSSQDLAVDVVEDAVGRSRATLVGLALASVVVLFVAGFFLSRFLAK